MFYFAPLKYPYGRLGIVNCVQAKGVYTHAHMSKPVWILATDVSDTDQEHSIILGTCIIILYIYIYQDVGCMINGVLLQPLSHSVPLHLINTSIIVFHHSVCKLQMSKENLLT